MPATTPNRGFPYPLGPDPINVAVDIEKLAKAIDLDQVTQENEHAAQQTQINNIAAQNNSQQVAIDQLWAQNDFMSSAANTFEVPTVVNNWTMYGITSLSLPSNFIYNVMITVGIQARSDGGGYIRLLAAINGSHIASNLETRCMTLAGESPHLVAQGRTVIGGGAPFTIEASVLTQNAGYAGPAWATVVATVQR